MAVGWRISPSRRVGGHWRIGYGQGRDFPQVAALHLRDGYLRLAPGTGWGTSVVLPPVFWQAGRLYQGAPISVQTISDRSDLELELLSQRGGLYTFLRVVFSPPEQKQMEVRVSAQTQGDLRLDARPNEAFKPVMLSSMRVSPDLWDANAVLIDDDVSPLHHSQAGWLSMPTKRQVTRFGLQGGTSEWKREAPTLQIALGAPLSVRGWITPSHDPNDDNLALWAASPQVLRAWHYQIRARSES